VFSVRKEVAKFLGVAELSPSERLDFVDEWNTRARKMHDDDLLLTRGKGRNTIVHMTERKTIPRTAEQREMLEAHGPARDTVDAQCVMLLLHYYRQWRHQDFPPGGGGTTNMFTKAGIHHRNVYIKKYDKLAHLTTHKMAWSFQRQASVISIKTVNNIPLHIIGV